MLEDAPDLDMLVVPIGGGGLMSGIAIAAKALKPDIELIGVEAELYPSMKCAVEGCPLPLGGDTLAEGIAVKQPGELTRASSRTWPTISRWSPSASSSTRWRCWSAIEKSVVEGAGAAGLAAMLADPERFKGKKVATVLCGGNIDTHLLANVLVRDLVRRAGSRGCGSPRRTGPARSPRSPPSSTRPGSTSSRSTTAASSAACRPRTR